MKKVYYLGNCDTCIRIFNEIEIPDDYEFQDVRKEPLTEEALDYLKELTGSYASFFDKRSKLCREREIDKKSLTEDDYKKLLLEHHSFLRKPIIVANDRVIVGNATKVIREARKYMKI